MKQIWFTSVLGLAVLATLPAQALTRKYPCDELIYDALTVEGDKRVQLCKSGNKLSYNFGSVNGKSELDVLFPKHRTTFYMHPYGHSEAPSVAMIRGDYTYTLSASLLSVTHYDTLLASIPLATPMYNNLRESLLRFNIPVSKRMLNFSSYNPLPPNPNQAVHATVHKNNSRFADYPFSL